MIRNISFETKVISAVWLQDKRKWKLVFQGQQGSLLTPEVQYFDIVFSAMGSLRIPNIPAEFKEFKGGPVVHTGAWDSSIDFKDKRVAIVGSGSRYKKAYVGVHMSKNYFSGIQVIPHLAKQAAQLTAYQRSAPWVFQMNIANLTKTQKKIFYEFPIIHLVYRFLLYVLVSCTITEINCKF